MLINFQPHQKFDPFFLQPHVLINCQSHQKFIWSCFLSYFFFSPDLETTHSFSINRYVGFGSNFFVLFCLHYKMKMNMCSSLSVVYDLIMPQFWSCQYSYLCKHNLRPPISGILHVMWVSGINSKSHKWSALKHHIRYKKKYKILPLIPLELFFWLTHKNLYFHLYRFNTFTNLITEYVFVFNELSPEIDFHL